MAAVGVDMDNEVLAVERKHVPMIPCEAERRAEAREVLDIIAVLVTGILVHLQRRRFSDQARKMFFLRYFAHGLLAHSEQEVAMECGSSQQNVSAVLRRAWVKLEREGCPSQERFEAILGYASRLEELGDAVLQVTGSVESGFDAAIVPL